MNESFEVSADELQAAYRYCQGEMEIQDGIIIRRLLGRMLTQQFGMKNNAWPSEPFRMFRMVGEKEND